MQHTVWRVAAHDERELMEAFGAMPALYIADGHHRAASAARARQHLSRAPATGEWDTFVAVAFPGDQTQILPYNRVVKDLGSHTPESLLAAIRERSSVKPGPATPARKGEVAMFLGGAWHTIEMTPAPAGTDPAADSSTSAVCTTWCWRRCSASAMFERISASTSSAGRGAPAELESLVSSGRAAVAFSLYPVSVADLMQISDAAASCRRSPPGSSPSFATACCPT